MDGRPAVRVPVLLAAYVAGGELGLWLSGQGGGVLAAVWPPMGFAVAAVVRWGRPYAAVATVADLAVSWHHGIPWFLALPFAAGNTLAILIAAWTISPSRATPDLEDIDVVDRVAVRAALLGPLAGAAVGLSALLASGTLRLSLQDGFLIWWLSDAVSILVFTPLLLLPRAAWRPALHSRGVRWALLGLLALTLAVFLWPVGTLARATRGYFLFPILMTIACTYGTAATAMATCLVGLAALAGIALSPPQGVAQVLDVQLLLAMQGASSLALAAVFAQARQESRRTALATARSTVLSEQSRFRGDLLLGAAHEMGNAVAPLHLRLAMPDAGDLAPPEAGLLRRVVDRILAITEDMKEAGRTESTAIDLRVAEGDLASVAGDAVAAFGEAAAHAGVRLALQGEPTLPVRMDLRRIQQVLENLVSNAIKYSPEGGTVTVEVRRAAGEARVEVRDTGLGFSAEQEAQLFLPFKRLHKAKAPAIPGTGLGLHIVRQIMDAHGGRCGASSQGAGQGAVFWFTIPLGTPGTGPPAQAFRKQRRADGRGWFQGTGNGFTPPGPASEYPRRLLHSMARMTLTTGSCPVCGQDVARTVSTHHGLALEHYTCPEHGRMESAPHHATVRDWVVVPTMASLSELLQQPIAAGIDWVR
jgi:signal transduction histidine kinase